ncbi:hypothetical protein Dsin_000426 [Dipteronia sinensis]|uniref:Pentatricopeptide repeat-containing protein n=1 Tax=Dipteronia sinensis TaxID=43782 RepID=A0AAE0B3F2_9ROSI|nr:hypothetical protein Dsin_000426 [Dipteronia sinensis]
MNGLPICMRNVDRLKKCIRCLIKCLTETWFLGSWNTIIYVYAQNGLARMALEFVVQMHEEGERRPDSITIVSILPAVVNIGSLRIGKAVHVFSQEWVLAVDT